MKSAQRFRSEFAIGIGRKVYCISKQKGVEQNSEHAFSYGEY